MGAIAYSFNQQLKKGESAERFLDSFFEQRFVVVPVTPERQRLGIDRVFTRRVDGQSFTVEYKTDWTNARTHKVFVETVSVDTANKPGWAYTSQANKLLYYLPGEHLVYVLAMKTIRKALPLWSRKFPLRKIPNRGYCTYGLVMDQWVFEQYSEAIIDTSSKTGG